jgi:predicted RNase H-like HicB family nuclease
MKLAYPAIFYPCQEGGFAVEVPDLHGCISQGEDLAEAMLMGAEAASGWILSELEDGQPIPPPSPLGTVKPDEEIGQGFVNMLALDLEAHARKYNRKLVKKNLELEIPAWLDAFAESRHVDYSKALQDSLTDLYQRQIHA